MGSPITLVSADGHHLGGYRADPTGHVRGGIVVLQEIFGVNHHIRNVCDRLAGAGYAAVAPALFDRQTADFQSGYSPDEVAEARKFLSNLDWPALLRDTAAAADSLKPSGPVGVMGFCLGGSVAFLAATRLEGLAAAVCYYGGQIINFADETPRVPTLMHFGATDHTIPLSDVEAIRTKRPDCEVHVYPAGHGFNCDERASYDPESAAEAWARSLAWFERAFSHAMARPE